MPSIKTYFIPGREFDAIQRFRDLKFKSQFLAVASTIFASLLTLAIGAIPTFRAVVYHRWMKEHPTKVDTLSKTLLSQPSEPLSTPTIANENPPNKKDDSSQPPKSQIDEKKILVKRRAWLEDMGPQIEEISILVKRPLSPSKETLLMPLEQEEIELVKPEVKSGMPHEPTNISGSTKYAIRRLKEDLKEIDPKLTLSSTVDNGECFFDAFAQGLLEANKGKFEIEDLKALTKNEKRDLENPENEGKVLAQHFNVNLRLIGETYVDKSIDDETGDPDLNERALTIMISEQNRIYTDRFYYGSEQSNQPTIILAHYPGHFLAVMQKNSTH